jgi:UMF1 family MFS transporter
MLVKNIISRQRFLILCWALYDTANQFFALNVVSVYFPRWLTQTKSAPGLYYSLAFAGSMILVAIFAPFLGTVSDIQKRKKVYLIFFTMLSVVFTFLIGVIDNVLIGLIFFSIANFGCQMAIVFYNALLINVAGQKKLGRVSGLGRMFGYAGALLAMLITKPIIKYYGYSLTLIVTAGAFFVLSLPIIIFVKDESQDYYPGLNRFLKKRKIIEVWGRIKAAFTQGAKFREIRLFLWMLFFGMCALQAIIIFFAVYAGEVFELTEAEIIDLIFFATFFAIVGSLISGYLGDKFGHKKIMSFVLGLWGLGFLAGALLRAPFHWFIAAIIGSVLSSTWVIVRAWAAKMAPRENIGEMFGLLNLAGYAGGVVGPLFWGLVLFIFSPLGVWRYRIALLSLIIFIFIAYLILIRIPSAKKR